MTQLRIPREEFLTYRSATAFLLSRVASADIRILMFFGQHGCECDRLVFLHCLREITKPGINNL